VAIFGFRLSVFGYRCGFRFGPRTDDRKPTT